MVCMPGEEINTRGGQRRYRYLLRPIGAYLDAIDARYVTLAEFQDGFIWHCASREDPTRLQSGTVALDEFSTLIDTIKSDKEARAREHDEMLRSRRGGRGLFRKSAVSDAEAEVSPHPVCQYGYEATFRSLGAKLEDQRGYMVLLVERAGSLIVSFSLPLPMYIRVDISRMETFTGFHEVEYSSAELRQIVEEVREHRGISYYQ